MANELTLGFSFAYSDANGVDNEMTASGVVDSLTNPVMARTPLLVSHTVDTAVPLGAVSGPTYLVVKNLDATNFVTVKTAASGTAIAKIKAGRFAVIPLPATITAPALLADSADVRVDVMVC